MYMNNFKTGMFLYIWYLRFLIIKQPSNLGSIILKRNALNYDAQLSAVKVFHLQYKDF